MGRIVRAIAKDASVVCSAIDGKDIAARIEEIHKPSAVVTAALGRLALGTSLMGFGLKGKDDTITVRLDGDGPAGMMICVADSYGNVKADVMNPVVEIPANSAGKLDVKGAVGTEGTLSVIKDMGLKEPYSGQCELKTGEIAEDLTYYFATSEQIPSAVGLGVLVDKDLSVKEAGGFIIQLMPFTPDEVIDKLEKKISEIDSVTKMLERGLTPEQILEEILGEFGLEITDKMDTAFRCDCSKERISRAISTLSKKDLDDIIADGESIEVKCQFCNTAYNFDIDELKELRK